MQIVWSPEAERDLESIRDYIAHDSVRYAELVVQRIVGSVERLSTFPESGRVVPELGVTTIREVIVDVFRVVYRLRGDLVEIATVFRGSVDGARLELATSALRTPPGNVGSRNRNKGSQAEDQPKRAVRRRA